MSAHDEADRLKHRAAVRVMDYVQSGMLLGLGTGSTAAYVVRELAARLRDGRLRDVLGVPTSERTRALAEHEGVPMTSLNDHPKLDLAIDGADEIAPNLDLIKGHGGALLREKIVATNAATFIVVGDASKRVQTLGESAAVPVEVVRFGWATQARFLVSLGARVELRVADLGEPFVTDEGHYILDCRFESIAEPSALSALLAARAGIVDSGLFLGIASMAIVGTAAGTDVLERE